MTQRLCGALRLRRAIATAVADGELAPMEAAELSKVMDSHTRAVETADLGRVSSGVESSAIVGIENSLAGALAREIKSKILKRNGGSVLRHACAVL